MSSGGHTVEASRLGAPISEDDGSLRIVFPPPVRWPAFFGLPLWLAIFIGGLVGMASEVPGELASMRPAEAIALTPFLLLFVVGWTLLGTAGLRLLLFNAAGREVMVIDNTDLTSRREAPLFTRVRTYELAEVRNLRATHSSVPFWLYEWGANSRYPCDLFGLTGGVIAFDYGGRTVRLGGGIDEEAATGLVANLIHEFPAVRDANRWST